MALSDLVFIDSTGFHMEDFPSFLAYFTQGYLNIYGQDVDLDSDTMDGQFIALLAQAAFDSANIGASVFNSFSPVTAQGVGLSRNVKINGLSRQIPSNSSADLTIVGSAATVITNGIAIDTLQQKWDLPASVTIPDSGTITVTATSETVGAINAEANTITGIFTPTLGWQTVNNVAAATPGAPVETDAQLRVRQQQSTADPSLTVFDGTIGGVENLSGVQKVKGYENDTGAPDANSIPAHSICVVVKGGDDMAIANEIALHKTPGTGTFGSTTELVFDAHGMPLNISFQRPVTATIAVRITLSTTVGWTTDYEATIASAVAALINSNKIGDTVILTKLYPAAYLPGNPAALTYDITLIEIKKNAGSFVTTNIALTFDEEAVTDPTVNVSFIVT